MRNAENHNRKTKICQTRIMMYLTAMQNVNVEVDLSRTSMERKRGDGMTTKEFEDFLEKEIMTEEDKKNIFAPPLEPQIALNILIEHFLGKDWYTPNPIGVKQVNTEAVYEILSRYPRRKEFLKRLVELWKIKR